jgi:hypothetical protein
MAKAWSTCYDFVLPHLPGLTPGAPADFLIKRAAIEFFDRSCAWRVAIPAFASAASATYVIANLVTNTQVARVLELRYLGRELEHKTPEWLREHYGREDWRAVTGSIPLYWTEEAPNEVTIIPAPTAIVAAVFSGWAAVKPLDDATGIQTDAVWREYIDTIAKLAKARGMEMPKKPYTDKAQAKELLAEVASEIGMLAFHREAGSGGVMRTKTHWI